MTAVLGVDGIRSRMSELSALVDPRASSASSPSSTSSTDFATLLADATSRSTPGGSSSDLLSSLGLSGTSSLNSLLARLTGTGTSAAGTDISGGTVSAQDLIADAKKYTGVAYKWGGESLSEGGLDCSGLVLRSLTDLGVTKVTDVPRTAREQQTLGTKVSSLDEALPGDLLVFNGGTHIGIYLGNNTMIDAPKPGGTVGVHKVYEEPSNIRRILPQEGATTTPSSTTSTTTALAQRTALAMLAGLGS
ncbi:MAG: C40 family peptidase [Actinobacteria bacterium]|nr:C40 family peptidase [Actinomycetota bacterium]